MQLIFHSPGKAMGRINNLSSLGVSVEYAEGEWQPAADQEVKVRLAIDVQSPLIMEDVPCMTIYDIATLAQNETFKGSKMRLCGLKYIALTDQQQEKLHQLLDSIR